MRFWTTMFGIAGGFSAFLVAVLNSLFAGSGAATLLLLSGGLLGMFAGSVVVDSAAIGAIRLGTAATLSAVGMTAVGLPAAAPTLVLIAGCLTAWRAARPTVSRHTPHVDWARPASTRREDLGDSSPAFERLNRLMGLADEARLRHPRAKTRRPRLY